MSGVKPATLSPKVTVAGKSTVVEKYDLLGDKRQWTSCLEIMNADHSHIIRDINRQYSRLFNEHECRVNLSLFTVEAVDNTSLQNNQIWLQACNGAGAKVLLSIDNIMLYNLAEIFLGASNPNIKDSHNEETPSDSEYRLLRRIFTIQLKALDSQLGLTNSWQISLANQPDDAQDFITAKVDCTLKEYPSSWQIWYHKEIVSDKLQDQSVPPDYEKLTEKLERAAEGIPTSLDVVLARTQLTLAELTQLKAGDFILMDLPEIVSAYTGRHPIAQGRVVVHSGRLVMQVTDTTN